MEKLRVLFCVSICLVAGVVALCGHAQDGPVYKPHQQPAKPKPTASSTLLVSCDLACEWTLDGKPQSAIAANTTVSIAVPRTDHLLIVSTTDGLDTVRKLVKVSTPGQTVLLIELQPVRDKRLNGQQDLGPQKKPLEHKRADTNDIWTDSATGLMWTRQDNGQNVNWHEAVSYCQNLHLAGYSDWRLPEIDELQGIYDPAQSVQGYGDCSKCKMHIKGKIRLSDFPWSHTAGNAAGVAWFFFFSNGNRYSSELVSSSLGRALCVRHAGE